MVNGGCICNEQICNVYECLLLPAYKKTLQGLAWHTLIHALIILKSGGKITEYKNLIDDMAPFKYQNNLNVTAMLSSSFRKMYCPVYEKTDCKDPQCLQNQTHEIRFVRASANFINRAIGDLLYLIEKHKIDKIIFRPHNIDLHSEYQIDNAAYDICRRDHQIL